MMIAAAAMWRWGGHTSTTRAGAVVRPGARCLVTDRASTRLRHLETGRKLLYLGKMSSINR